MTAPSNSPTSWRDVYQLVQDVELRLTKRMEDIAQNAGATATDHEIRIRVLERTDVVDVARRDTYGKVAGISRATLLTVMSVGSMAVAIVSLLLPG